MAHPAGGGADLLVAVIASRCTQAACTFNAVVPSVGWTLIGSVSQLDYLDQPSGSGGAQAPIQISMFTARYSPPPASSTFTASVAARGTLQYTVGLVWIQRGGDGTILPFATNSGSENAAAGVYRAPALAGLGQQSLLVACYAYPSIPNFPPATGWPATTTDGVLTLSTIARSDSQGTQHSAGVSLLCSAGLNGAVTSSGQFPVTPLPSGTGGDQGNFVALTACFLGLGGSGVTGATGSLGATGPMGQSGQSGTSGGTGAQVRPARQAMWGSRERAEGPEAAGQAEARERTVLREKLAPLVTSGKVALRV
jgi:hypothetical protein